MDFFSKNWSTWNDFDIVTQSYLSWHYDFYYFFISYPHLSDKHHQSFITSSMKIKKYLSFFESEKIAYFCLRKYGRVAFEEAHAFMTSSFSLMFQSYPAKLSPQAYQ